MKHKHHLVPKHMGGSDDPSNLVEVSVEEHAELHLSLYLEHGNWQDLRAAYGLAGLSGWECVNGYGFKGRRHTEETKRKISEASKRPRKKGKLSESHKEALRQAGLRRADQVRQSLVGRKRDKNGRLLPLNKTENLS